MTTITGGATTITPQLVTGYQSARAAGTIVHEIPGADMPSATLAVASSRAGTLSCLFLTEAAAVALEALLQTAAIFTFADPDIPLANMTFVLTGSIDRALEDTTRRRWTVSFGYREV